MPTGTDPKKKKKAAKTIKALSPQAEDQERGSLVLTKRKGYPKTVTQKHHMIKANKFSKMCLNDPKEGIPPKKNKQIFL